MPNLRTPGTEVRMETLIHDFLRRNDEFMVWARSGRVEIFFLDSSPISWQVGVRIDNYLLKHRVIDPPHSSGMTTKI